MNKVMVWLDVNYQLIDLQASANGSGVCRSGYLFVEGLVQLPVSVFGGDGTRVCLFFLLFLDDDCRLNQHEVYELVFYV